MNELIVVNRSPTVVFDNLEKLSEELIVLFSEQVLSSYAVNKVWAPTWKNKKIKTYF